MTDSSTRKNLWDCAGKAGIVLGIVSIAYSVSQQPLQTFAPKLGTFLTFLINTTLWLGKFLGCIYLMRYFMRRFMDGQDGVGRKEANAFGLATALSSALIVSAFSLAYAKFINPEAISDAIDTAITSYSSMLDANSLDAIDHIRDKMPMISFFSTLIYCFIYGAILSVILSRKYNHTDNPFEEQS